MPTTVVADAALSQSKAPRDTPHQDLSVSRGTDPLSAIIGCHPGLAAAADLGRMRAEWTR